MRFTHHTKREMNYCVTHPTGTAHKQITIEECVIGISRVEQSRISPTLVLFSPSPSTLGLPLVFTRAIPCHIDVFWLDWNRQRGQDPFFLE